MEVTTIYAKLAEMQGDLKVPKGRHNTFGGFNYRSCEDILNAIKPHLRGMAITLSDEIISIGERVYVKATATLADDFAHVSCTGFAREQIEKKGMDPAQVTGAASSYARKYALCGLFAIDDEKDPDADESGRKDTGNNRKSEPPANKTTRINKESDLKTNAVKASRSQVQRIQILFKDLGVLDRDEKIKQVNEWLQRCGINTQQVSSTNDLPSVFADKLIKALEKKLNAKSQTDPFATSHSTTREALHGQ